MGDDSSVQPCLASGAVASDDGLTFTAVGAAGGKAQQHDKRKRERDYSLFHFFTLSFQIILRLLSESRGRMRN